MLILGIDAGSSGIKTAVLRDGMVVSPIARRPYATRFDGLRAEVDGTDVLKALAGAVSDLTATARAVDAIALANMAPSWVALDAKGNALTPIVTHQDRRSVEIARELERRVGRERHLALAGNRPFPGGISSTTWAWHLQHAPGVMKRADLAGHLTTYLHRQLTGARVTDPSNASFMGIYRTVELGGWCEELCEPAGIRPSLLPEIRQANEVAGRLTIPAARRLGLLPGTPMLAGCMDGSAAMLLARACPGQVFNVSGTTDVLALCTDRPRPHESLLTRALGIGRLWLSVSTLAAGGSTLLWIHRQLFAEYTAARFWRLVGRLADRPVPTQVRFEPYLAGDRMSIEQRQGAFTGLTLASTRKDMLAAAIEAMAVTSAARIPLLQEGGVKMKRKVLLSGGVQSGLAKVLHRDWPGRWTFYAEDEATLRGLGRIQPKGI